MKQTIAQAANTTADKVQTSMVDSADTVPARRLADGSVVTTSYTVSVANSAEAQRVHSALQGTEPADMDAIFQKKLVANNATGYTAKVTDHTVSDLPTAADCKDVTESSTDAVEAKCYDNALWAKETGSQTKKEWYVNYPTVTKESSVAAWQCVLYQKSLNREENGGKESHNCSKPCNFNKDCTAASTSAAFPPPKQETPMKKPEDGGMSVWLWVLIIFGVC